MKKLFVILTAVCVFLFGSASFAKEPRVSKIETKDKSYVGHYDESMTPENSCVIFFYFTGTQKSTFRQINPRCDIDEQTFDFNLMENQMGTVIFKPCKPGSRYMLTYIKGTISDSRTRTYWEGSLSFNNRAMVIDVPKEPGIYCFGQPWGKDVVEAENAGIPYDMHEPDSSKYNKRAYKIGFKMFKQLYEGTPWLDAYIEKMNTIENTTNPW